MTDKKNNMVGVKLNDQQLALLDKLITSGVVKNRSGGIQYLINQQIILGK